MELIDALGVTELQARQDDADLDILAMGVTFTVYSDGRGIDRAWPFDVIPRVIDATEWRRIEAGLVQRLAALNQFIDDVYNDQHVVTDGVFPAELLAGASNFRPECRGVRPSSGCGRTSAAATWCATPPARSTCWRTTCGCRPGSATCWRTAWCPSGPSPTCSPTTSSPWTTTRTSCCAC
jgi:hypothetical protein